MRAIIITIFLSAITLTCFGQYGKDFRNLGDRAFADKDYYEAAFYYRKVAEGMHLLQNKEVPFQTMNKAPKKDKPSDATYVSYRLAESYRLYENYIEAEGWYKKTIDAPDMATYPLARLWHGVCLRAIQRFDDAITELQQFNAGYDKSDENKVIANKEIANCTFAKEQYKYPQLLEVVKLKGDWNSDGSDYALLQTGDNFMFTSSRFAKDDKKHINRIYTANAAGGLKPQVITLKDNDAKKDAEYGTPSLTPDGKRMYLTRWYKEGSKVYHSIYFTQKQDSTWQPLHKLDNNVNADGYNAIQPFITADGKKLFFVSNKPGGFGGDDIWVSDLGDDGEATNAVNLGSTINTDRDEQAPYYNADEKKLIYSSKGFTGLGGFDFFESKGDIGNWSTPVNMGYPMNSAKDDLYFIPDNKDTNKWYISSDRESDCCLNLFEVHNKSFILAGIVTDCETRKPLAGVKVSFVDSLAKQTLKELTTGADAKYVFKVTSKRPYNLKLEKTGYFTKVLPIPASGQMGNDTLYNAEICLQAFEKDKPIVINNILYDFNKATLRPESKTVLNSLVTIMKDNPKIIVRLGAHTDSIGSVKYNIKLSQARAQSCVDYIISQGITSERIYAKGYGKSMPVAPNSLPNGKDNPEGRQLNRRTEFTVVKTE
jgi:outer membrane protein OmpA-like peptidoglycan-associated protein